MTAKTETTREKIVNECVERVCVVIEAVEWMNTPFVPEARIKGAGCDCAQLLIGVYVNAGLIEPFTTEHHPEQWHLHSGEELYLREVVKYAQEVEKPLPGDIVAFRVKRAYAHAGIVVDWPSKIIHCLQRGGVQWGDASRDAFLIMEQREHPPKFFSLWKHAGPQLVAFSKETS